MFNVPQMPEKQIQFNLVQSIREYVLNQAQIFPRANNYDILYPLGALFPKLTFYQIGTLSGRETAQNTWIIFPKLNLMPEARTS